jgi:hypothetical protein
MDFAMMENMNVKWTDYMKYRAETRSYDLQDIERIVRSSTEKYFDTETKRRVIIGQHKNELVIVPFEIEGDCIVPVTIHAITRQQIRFRLNTGRFAHE